MNEVWDLSILYKDFDDPAFTGDMKALDEAIAAVNALAGEAAGMEHSQLVHRFLQVQERVEELANKLFIFCSLRCSANTADTKANSLGDQLSAKLSGCAAANASLRRTVAELEDLDAIMDADPALEPYRFLLESIRRDSKYLLTDREEELFARMNISGASAWESLRDNLTSSVKVEYDGGITNLSAIRNLAYDPDPAVRKSAYEAELACYDKIKDSVAYALNSIKLQVINECQVRGYASPLDKALYQSRMKRETLDALLGAMDEYLPKFWQYLRAKGKALGHENGLPWYELFAPMGKSDKKYTTQDAKDYLLSIFSGFDSQLHDMVERAFDEAWIDFYPRNGKVGGAFDCGVPSARQSRVLTNFDGAFGDIVTLAHELGHAFHDQQVFSHPLVCQEYTMPVAEDGLHLQRGAHRQRRHRCRREQRREAGSDREPAVRRLPDHLRHLLPVSVRVRRVCRPAGGVPGSRPPVPDDAGGPEEGLRRRAGSDLPAPVYVAVQGPLLQRRPEFLQLPLCLRRPVCPWPVCQVSAGGQGLRAAV